MSSFPAIITQDAEDDLTMAVPKIAVPKSSPESISSPDSSKLIPDIKKKKLVQQSMFGKPLPHFKLKVRVCSYKKKDGTLVKKHTRGMTSKKSKNPLLQKRISFKHCNNGKHTLKETVDLVHSLHDLETLDLICNSFTKK